MDQSMDKGFRWLTVSPKGQPDFQFILMKVDGTNIKPEAAAALKGYGKRWRGPAACFKPTIARPPTEISKPSWFSMTQPKMPQK